MSDMIKLNAEPRSDLGKGASRRLRKSGLVPAIIYGADSEPTSINLQHNDFIHALENEAIYTQVLDLRVGKTKEEVILRDLQRHPFKNLIMHADFLRIDKKKVLHITVPVHFENEDNCHGVKLDGGMLNRLMNEIEVIALPKNLPEYLELNVADLKMGETLHLSDIKLPEGVDLAAFSHEEDSEGEHDVGVVSVIEVRGETIVEETDEEGNEAEAASDSDSEDAGEE